MTRENVLRLRTGEKLRMAATKPTYSHQMLRGNFHVSKKRIFSRENGASHQKGAGKIECHARHIKYPHTIEGAAVATAKHRARGLGLELLISRCAHWSWDTRVLYENGDRGPSRLDQN